MNKFLFFLTASVLLANPTGMELIEGNANLEVMNQTTLHVIVDDKTILHWDDFSILENETTKFFQPNEHASVLNRVIGNNLSAILGRLEANGHLLLINQNGVIFGENSSVETGGLTASTLDLVNENFLQGSALRLRGESKASIVNLGRYNRKLWMRG